MGGTEQNSFLSSIQKGVRLRKAKIVNDRSAPNIKGKAAQQEGTGSSAQEKPPAPGQRPSLFTNGFPALKRVGAAQGKSEGSCTQGNEKLAKSKPVEKDNSANAAAAKVERKVEPAKTQLPAKNEPKSGGASVVMHLPTKNSISPGQPKRETVLWRFPEHSLPSSSLAFYGGPKTYLNGSCGLFDFTDSLFFRTLSLKDMLQELETLLEQNMQRRCFEECVRIQKLQVKLKNSASSLSPDLVKEYEAILC